MGNKRRAQIDHRLLMRSSSDGGRKLPESPTTKSVLMRTGKWPYVLYGRQRRELVLVSHNLDYSQWAFLLVGIQKSGSSQK